MTKKTPPKTKPPTVAEVTMADLSDTGVPDTPKTRAGSAETVQAVLARLGKKKTPH
jgi:hypothetical protein